MPKGRIIRTMPEQEGPDLGEVLTEIGRANQLLENLAIELTKVRKEITCLRETVEELRED